MLQRQKKQLRTSTILSLLLEDLLHSSALKVDVDSVLWLMYKFQNHGHTGHQQRSQLNISHVSVQADRLRFGWMTWDSYVESV